MEVLTESAQTGWWRGSPLFSFTQPCYGVLTACLELC